MKELLDSLASMPGSPDSCRHGPGGKSTGNHRGSCTFLLKSVGSADWDFFADEVAVSQAGTGKVMKEEVTQIMKDGESVGPW